MGGTADPFAIFILFLLDFILLFCIITLFDWNKQ